MAGQDWTFWFNMTNFALGMITVLAVAVVCGAVGWDLFALWLHKARKTDTVTDSDLANITADLRAHWQEGPHALSVPGLGLTMADGGEKIEPSESEPKQKSPRK